eukprot:5797913-Amphidinium_carterae.1
MLRCSMVVRMTAAFLPAGWQTALHHAPAQGPAKSHSTLTCNACPQEAAIVNTERVHSNTGEDRYGTLLPLMPQISLSISSDDHY